MVLLSWVVRAALARDAWPCWWQCPRESRQQGLRWLLRGGWEERAVGWGRRVGVLGRVCWSCSEPGLAGGQELLLGQRVQPWHGPCSRTAATLSPGTARPRQPHSFWTPLLTRVPCWRRGEESQQARSSLPCSWQRLHTAS